MLAGLLAAADAFSSSSPACEVVHFSGAYVKDPSWPLYTAQGYIKGEGVQDKRDAPTGDKEHIHFSCGEGGPLLAVEANPLGQELSRMHENRRRHPGEGTSYLHCAGKALAPS